MAALTVTAIQAGQAIAQTANSNAGLQGGQDGMFDAILATPNYRPLVLPDSALATAPGLEQAVPTPQFTLNVLAPALYNSNAQFLSSGGSKTLEGSPLVRLGWASQLFDTPIRMSGAAYTQYRAGIFFKTASRSGGWIMYRRGSTPFRVSLSFLLIAACMSVQSACEYPGAPPSAPEAVAPVPAVAPAAPAPAIQLADGTWTVRGTRVPGSRRCGEWLVRLTSAGGRLSGTISHARNTAIPIQDLVLMPDGSFSGTTQASVSGSKRAPPATVNGRFSGDRVNLTFDSERCPPRQGTATRRALDG